MIKIAKSKLSVITKVKELCSHIMTVTDKSPKRFRFTLVLRLQNYALDIIEDLIMANEIFVSTGNMRSAAMYYYDDPVNHTNGKFDIITMDEKGYVFYEVKFKKVLYPKKQ